MVFTICSQGKFLNTAKPLFSTNGLEFTEADPSFPRWWKPRGGVIITHAYTCVNHSIHGVYPSMYKVGGVYVWMGVYPCMYLGWWGVCRGFGQGYTSLTLNTQGIHTLTLNTHTPPYIPEHTRAHTHSHVGAWWMRQEFSM